MTDTQLDQMTRQFWPFLIQSLKNHADENRHGYWSDGEDILCKTEEQANHLADFLEDLGYTDVTTGHYDLAEDERDGCVDALTGYYYVSI